MEVSKQSVHSKMQTACLMKLCFFTSPCDFHKNVTSELLTIPSTTHRPIHPPATINHDNVYTITNDYKSSVCCLHTCAQTLFNTQYSRKTQEIFRRTHNKKRPHFIEPFQKKCVLQTRAFLTIVLSSPLVLSRLTTAVIVFFFVWQ